MKSKGEKDRYIHLNAEFQRIARRDKKVSSVINAKKQRKTIEWERLELSSRKLEISSRKSPARGIPRAQEKPCATTGSPTETEPDLSLSV